jgi:hypothetical protein
MLAQPRGTIIVSYSLFWREGRLVVIPEIDLSADPHSGIELFPPELTSCLQPLILHWRWARELATCLVSSRQKTP